jgi:DNA modification methylase
MNKKRKRMTKCLADFKAFSGDGFTVFHGSNLDVLPFMADNSVDSIVTDPPYELGFMGKKWDSTGIAYSVELWQECLRVLKPGGHLLAFGGSRTWHRLAVAIEDAGFDVRDSIAWLYGSGFPKSLDISKAIDKRRDDSKDADKIVEYLQSKLPVKVDWSKVDELLGTVGSKQKFFVLSTKAFKARVMRWEQWLKTKDWLGLDSEMDNQVWRLNGRKGQPGDAWAEREVIGKQDGRLLAVAPGQDNDRSAVTLDITAPATPEAEKWAGWGTALKPAFEPVVVARKPLIGTVAENVLTWGVGGLNIDGSRIGWASEADRQSNVNAGGFTKPGWVQEANVMNRQDGGLYDVGRVTNPNPVSTLGRWPANIILDEYTAGLLDEQSGVTRSPAIGSVTKTQPRHSGSMAGGFQHNPEGMANGYGDSGGASRFFYVAKASKRDRNEGLDELPAISAGVGDNRPSGDFNQRLGTQDKPAQPKQNFHPTVKPTDLMRYLIKLVTPAGGTVLDPFTGSGSTGKAAILDGYQFVGIELTEEYLPIIEGRLTWAANQTAQQQAAEQQEKEERLF